MSISIYCVGGANFDYKFKSLSKLQLETSNPVSSATSFGGVARNIAENLANWTTHIHLQTGVGNDSEGNAILKYMQQLGVNIDHCQVLDNVKTARYYAVLDEKGNLHLALADMKIYDQLSVNGFLDNWQTWPANSLILIDTNLPTELLNFLPSFSSKFKICVDPVSAIKAKKLLHLDGMFLIKPNQFELEALTGLSISSVDDALIAGQSLLERGVKNIIVSLGDSGYIIINEHMQKHVPVKSIAAIQDVNGAGDAFFAGILYGIQQQYSIEQACELGHQAACQTLLSDQTVVPFSLKHEVTHATIL